MVAACRLVTCACATLGTTARSQHPGYINQETWKESAASEGKDEEACDDIQRTGGYLWERPWRLLERVLTVSDKVDLHTELDSPCCSANPALHSHSSLRVFPSQAPTWPSAWPDSLSAPSVSSLSASPFWASWHLVSSHCPRQLSMAKRILTELQLPPQTKTLGEWCCIRLSMFVTQVSR